MKTDFSYRSRDGATSIHGINWAPEGKPKAVLQICHGMVEYIGRYGGFAEYLSRQGFCVVGNDHLGHGASVQNDEAHGFFHLTKGNECLIGDIHKLRKIMQKKYPDIPYFMLGHSMGSFLLRQYIELHGDGLAGAIIMGTGSQPEAILALGKMFCCITAAIHGWGYRSKFIDGLAFGFYNKQFEPTRTDKDWLTKDEKIVDAFRADPWCTFMFTVNAYYHMFRGIQFVQKAENIERIPKDLPLFFVAGDSDPVGNNGKGVAKAFRACRKHGIKNMRMKLYKDDRHELLNETDREAVYKDLLEWMLGAMAEKGSCIQRPAGMDA